MSELPKTYDPREVEPRWARLWAEHPFRADAHSSKPPFTVVMPPPNLTGSLHLGHALDNTLIDTLIRYRRMQGFEALYLPGTDHASIAVHVLIERQLQAEGLTRAQLGREKFLERAWQWKEASYGEIHRQLQRLGISADWTRERFTLSPELSRAVRYQFILLYHQGLAYRGQRIVNWDPVGQTVVSDLEVKRKEQSSALYILEYPAADGQGGLRIATQRPETIFADVAIAVHPEDPRYRAWIGRHVFIPLTDRLIPVIADPAVDPEFGTGALKITPAHDPTDFEIGERHGLPRPSIIDREARLTSELVPPRYRGLDRFEARVKVAEELAQAGFLKGIEPHTVQLPVSERTKAPIEPLLMEQWFVRMKPLAEQALEGLKRGEIQILPERYLKVNQDWLEQIRDWNISRQLWWGHPIPAWYDAEGNVYVPDPSNPDLDCDRDPRYAHLQLQRDPDVFDTWFSSNLWPLSTLGWPNTEDPDFLKFYPTDVLVTGYDILFFWVARMEMAGYHFTGRPPFRKVFLHGLYLDAKGQKMSKSKGNGIDPLELVDRYGGDACRFAWVYLATGGQDIRHDERRYEQGRNFVNKLYNAARLVFLYAGQPLGEGEEGLADRWMRSRLQKGIEEISQAYEDLDFGRIARLSYELVWDEFCDWYLEASKPALRAGRRGSFQALRSILVDVLKLLHPLLPFITSELYQRMEPDSEQLALQSWPQVAPRDLEAEAAFERIREVARAARLARAELGLKPQQELPLALQGDVELLLQEREILETLGNFRLRDPFEGPSLEWATPHASLRFSLAEWEAQEIARYQKRQQQRLEELEAQLTSLQERLRNPRFLNAADPEVVEQARQRAQEHQAQIERLREHLARLGA
jgi:valyl-tRNA synthetase